MKHALKLKISGLVICLSITFFVLSYLLLLVPLSRYATRMRRQFMLQWSQITESAMKQGRSHPLLWVEEAGRNFDKFQEGYRFWLIDEDGRVIDASSSLSLPRGLGAMPPTAHQIAEGSLGPRYCWLAIRLDTPRAEFLVLGVDRWREVGTRGLWLLFGFALWNVLGGVLISMVVVFFYFRSRAGEARRILSRLQKGELAARFPKRHFDELGQLTGQFNQMASEIERLVHRLRATEQARALMLQEVSHDLRTPLASCRTVIEVAHNNYDQLVDTDRKRCLAIATVEVTYLQHLIENIFFLAEMEEPKYREETSEIDLREVLNAEMEKRRAGSHDSANAIGASTPVPAADDSTVATVAQHGSISWVLHVKAKRPALLRGSLPLIIRLVRNALDNAGKFARREVVAEIDRLPGRMLELVIRDDGPGLSEEQRRNFGVRRSTRLTAGSLASGKSLGLGSVIMKEITTLHGGSMEITSGENGTVLRFTFPAVARTLSNAA